MMHSGTRPKKKKKKKSTLTFQRQHCLQLLQSHSASDKAISENPLVRAELVRLRLTYSIKQIVAQ